jgi:hypothetical protein
MKDIFLSIKNDIEMVKEELTSEEKFFETSVITERFVKKYKNLLIAGVAGVVLLAVGNTAYEYNKASTIQAANETLSSLQKNPSDEQALEQLGVLSPALHDLYQYSQAIASQNFEALDSLKNSKVFPLADLASYEVAQNKKDLNALTSYALTQDAIYKDLAQIQAAIILINQGEAEKAHSKLLTIADASPLSRVAKALLHYGVK